MKKHHGYNPGIIRARIMGVAAWNIPPEAFLRAIEKGVLFEDIQVILHSPTVFGTVTVNLIDGSFDRESHFVDYAPGDPYFLTCTN